MQITVSANVSTHSSHFEHPKNNKSMQMRSSDFQIRPKTMRAVSRPFISRAAITWARRSRSSCPSRPPSSNEPLGQSERCPAAAPISARLLLRSSVDSWSTNCSAGAAVSWRWFFRRISAIFRRLVRLQRRWVDFRHPRPPVRSVGRRHSPGQLSPRALTGNSACDSLLLFVRFPYFCDHWIDDKWVHCGFELISRSPWGPSAPLSHPDPADRALTGLGQSQDVTLSREMISIRLVGAFSLRKGRAEGVAHTRWANFLSNCPERSARQAWWQNFAVKNLKFQNARTEFWGHAGLDRGWNLIPLDYILGMRVYSKCAITSTHLNRSFDGNQNAFSSVEIICIYIWRGCSPYSINLGFANLASGPRAQIFIQDTGPGNF